MTTDFAGDDTVFPALITTPSDGELRNAASVQTPYEQLADRTASLNVIPLGTGYVRNWHEVPGGAVSPPIEFELGIRGGDTDPISGVWLVGGDTNGCSRSINDARTFETYVTGMAGEGTVGIEDIAIGGSSTAIAVGGETASDLVYRQADVSANAAWTSLSVGTVNGFFQRVVFDAFNDRYIIVGSTTGSASGPATAEVSTTATGTAFTTATTIPAGFSTKPFGSLAVKDTASIAVASSSAAHTKIAFSTDGGDVWSDSTTTVVSGVYSVTFSVHFQLFYAARHDNTTTAHVYSSPDGDVWTLVFSGSMGFTQTNNEYNGRGIVAMGPALIVRGNITAADRPSIAISLDGGSTWSVQLVSEVGNDGPLISSRNQRKILFITTALLGFACDRIGPG